MKQSIIFRIQNLKGTGLGHLKRSLDIATQVLQYGHKVHCIVDEKWPEEFEIFKKDLSSITVLSEIEDTVEESFILRFASNISVKKIFSDSYTLNSNWYETLNNNGLKLYKLVDHPDQINPNVVNIPTGIRFINEKSPGGNSFENLAMSHVIIDKKFRNVTHNKNSQLKVMLYLGGEGNNGLALKILPGIIQGLVLSKLKISLFLMNISKDSRNRNLWEHPNLEVKFVNFDNNFSALLSSMDLVLASASNILYETAYLKIPCISFPQNESQNNSQYQVEQIGHFISLDQLNDIYDEKFPKLLSQILQDQKILKAQFEFARYRVDTEGSKRIASILLDKKNKSQDTFLNKKNRSRSKNTTANNSENLSLIFRPTELRDLSCILSWRNNSEVRKFMINSDLILKFAHICWWFNNSRTNLIGEINGQPKIYLWHELTKIGNVNFVTSGWILLSEDFHVTQILEAQRFQIQLVRGIAPDISWLTVIHKKNAVALWMAGKSGYKIIEPNESMHRIALEFFFKNTSDINFFVLKR
jgi:spore coat polysaccharide biosynthesis predicted glycosyltransferase SpsG